MAGLDPAILFAVTAKGARVEPGHEERRGEAGRGEER